MKLFAARIAFFASILVAVLGSSSALAAEAGVPMDTWPVDRVQNQAALQNGARLFASYCIGCHSASLVRWNRLQEVGLTDAQIQQFLIFGNQKVGDTIRNSASPSDQKRWFGKAPPDLSVITRARTAAGHAGTDYVYTLLRGYYRDAGSATGWNNVVYPNVAMPHALWALQGERGWDEKEHRFTEISKGTLSPTEYDATVRDLVNFLVYAGEPAATSRKTIGIVVLFVLLGVLLPLTYWLKKEFWKDVK